MRNRERILFTAAAAALALLCRTIGLPAQEIDRQWVEANYTKTEALLPMRDGIRLYTAVYAPKDTVRTAPLLISRTPYSLAPYGPEFALNAWPSFLPFLRQGYIIVLQNVRGRMASEGTCVEVRPVSEKAAAGRTDEATDSYDTVEWLLRHTRNNGNVGFIGVSYSGFYATVAALCGHPAIKAVSPQAPIADWFMGDDVHLNGALVNSIFSFGARHFRPQRGPLTEAPPAIVRPQGNYYDYFLNKGSISGVFADFGDSLQFFNEIRKHPDYDRFWMERNPLRHVREGGPAVMVVGGWYDREDFYGTLRTYKAFQERGSSAETFLVMGPWYHGGWNNFSFQKMAGAWFGTGSSEYCRDSLVFPFFEKYLHGRTELEIPAVRYLPSAETRQELMAGRDSAPWWKTAGTWPPAGVSFRRCYLMPDRSLTTAPPPEKARRSVLSYLSDPFRPVPDRNADFDSWGAMQAVGDQSFLHWRSDLLTFTGEELTDTLKVTGPVKVKLSLSASTTDADIVVKLIDARPDGYQMLVRWTVLPLRYRHGFSKPEPVVPGRRMELQLELADIAHYFLPGHRLMCQIQSSIFPWIAMSPQQFLAQPYYAEARDYRKSEIKVYCGTRSAAYIELPVAE